MDILEDYPVKEICVDIINETGAYVYLNTQPTPGGVLIRRGRTYIEDRNFFIVAAHDYPVDVVLSGPIMGKPGVRMAENRSFRECTLPITGAAFGMQRLRTLAKDGCCNIRVTIKRG